MKKCEVLAETFHYATDNGDGKSFTQYTYEKGAIVSIPDDLAERLTAGVPCGEDRTAAIAAAKAKGLPSPPRATLRLVDESAKTSAPSKVENVKHETKEEIDDLVKAAERKMGR